MAEVFIHVIFHHGGEFVNGNYATKFDFVAHRIGKDKLSLSDLRGYTREMGYAEVGPFYYKSYETKRFVEIENDLQLSDAIKHHGHGDLFNVYVTHLVGEPVKACEGGTNTTVNGDVSEALSGPTCTEEGSGANEKTCRVVSVNMNDEEGTDADMEESGFGSVPLNNEEGAGINIGENRDTNEGYVSEEDDIGAIRDEYDSDVDEKLIAIREAARQNKRVKAKNKAARSSNKKPRKESRFVEVVVVGEAGVDKGFEDIGANRKDKFVGKLAGDEDYLDSSNCASEDSQERLDPLAHEGVDLPSRKKSTNLRYDFDFEVSLFELGMIFENANEFKKAIAEYAVQNKTPLRLKPNESERVRVRCKSKGCRWLIYASKDKQSGTFVVKTYIPVHNCLIKNKNRDEPMKPKSGKLSRRGVKQSCSICCKHGHNKVGCPSRVNSSDRGESSSQPITTRTTDGPAAATPTQGTQTSCPASLFELGMIFENANEFKKAIAEYAVQNKIPLRLKPNESERVSVRCKSKDCRWLIYASKDKQNGKFVVKTCIPVHNCLTKNKNRDEPMKPKCGKLSRRGVKQSCSICCKHGHNKGGCPSRVNSSDRGESSSQPITTRTTDGPAAATPTQGTQTCCPASLFSAPTHVRENTTHGRGKGRGSGATAIAIVSGEGSNVADSISDKGSCIPNTSVSATAKSDAAVGRKRVRSECSGLGIYSDTARRQVIFLE